MKHHISAITQTIDRIPIPEKEAKDLERRSVKLLQLDQPQTEAPPIPTSTNVTSSLFEYDITGLRVKSIGQATGGFLREVSENESAFAFSLQDDISLYLIFRIASSDNSIELKTLAEIIHNGNGWLRFSILMKAGLVEVIGSQVRVTDRGLRELDIINSYCRLSK